MSHESPDTSVNLRPSPARNEMPVDFIDPKVIIITIIIF